MGHWEVKKGVPTDRPCVCVCVVCTHVWGTRDGCLHLHRRSTTRGPCLAICGVLAALCFLICEMCCLYLRGVPELHETMSVKDLVFCPTHRKGELVIFHISFLF